MKREVIIKLDRSDIYEIISAHLEKVYPDMGLKSYSRVWTDIHDTKGQTPIDDEKCPETFTFHFADAI